MYIYINPNKIDSIRALIENIKLLKSSINNPFNSESIPNPIGNYSLSKFLAEENLKKIASKNSIDLIDGFIARVQKN